jgi:hypothetical protein
MHYYTMNDAGCILLYTVILKIPETWCCCCLRRHRGDLGRPGQRLAASLAAVRVGDAVHRDVAVEPVFAQHRLEDDPPVEDLHLAWS